MFSARESIWLFGFFLKATAFVDSVMNFGEIDFERIVVSCPGSFEKIFCRFARFVRLQKYSVVSVDSFRISMISDARYEFDFEISLLGFFGPTIWPGMPLLSHRFVMVTSGPQMSKRRTLVPTLIQNKFEMKTI